MSRKNILVMVRLDDALNAQLLAACERYSVSRSALLREALEQWLTLTAWKDLQATTSTGGAVTVTRIA